MFQCDQCSYSSCGNYNIKRHERLNHYPEQSVEGIKRKDYPIQYEKGVEKNAEEDTDSVNSDDSDMEDSEKVEETLRIDKVTPEENKNRNFSDIASIEEIKGQKIEDSITLPSCVTNKCSFDDSWFRG